VRLGGVGADGLRRFQLASLLRELLRDNERWPMSDWGSSGHRFKSCQPGTGQRVSLIAELLTVWAIPIWVLSNCLLANVHPRVPAVFTMLPRCVPRLAVLEGLALR
jgi:hypothetical protein